MTKPIPEYFLPAEEHLSWEIPTPVGRLEIERRDGVWSYVAIDDDDDDEDEDEDADNAPDLIMRRCSCPVRRPVDRMYCA